MGTTLLALHANAEGLPRGTTTARAAGELATGSVREHTSGELVTRQVKPEPQPASERLLPGVLERSTVPNSQLDAWAIPDPTQARAVPQGGAEVSSSAIALPSGAATTMGMGESFTTQLTTGTASLSVPIEIPAGRGGNRPSLALTYSTGAGAGIAGMGWSIGAGVIQRQTDRGIPRYQDSAGWHAEQDRFTFSGDELVPICVVQARQCTGLIAGEVLPIWSDGWQYFRARAENKFLRFFWSPDHRTWRVQGKDGSNFEFGVPLDGSGSVNALERNPTRPEQIFAWHLARQYDSYGAVEQASPQPVNLAVYRYTPSYGSLVLTDIFSTPPAGPNPSASPVEQFAHHVRLSYEPRGDVTESYRSGWLLRQTARLARIEVASKPFVTTAATAREVNRRYHLSYDPDSHMSLLASVQIEGRCATPVLEGTAGTACPRLPAMSFEYQRVEAEAAGLLDENGLSFEPISSTVTSILNSPKQSLGDAETTLADVNSDGLADVLVTAPELFSGKHAVFFNRPFAPDGSHSFDDAVLMDVAGVSDVDTKVLSIANPNVAALDLDADGRINLVHMPQVKQYSIFKPSFEAGAWLWRGSTASLSAQSPKINFQQDARRVAVMDVNADGMVDLVFAAATEMQTFYSLARYPGGQDQFGTATRLSATTAQISNNAAIGCVPWSATAVRFGDLDVRVAEMNGDGLPDIVRVRDGQILYWPGRGNGHWGTREPSDCTPGSFVDNAHIEMSSAPKFGVTFSGNLQLGDVNGDGLADLVEVRTDGVDIFLNDNGRGWTDRHTVDSGPEGVLAAGTVRIADINGSGTSDIVWGRGREYRYLDLAGGARPHVLTRMHNGLGKTLELQYSTSARLMREAEEAGAFWSTTMPMVVPVVTRSVTRDNLEVAGLPSGQYVTEYVYRDPVYDGLQREFRGFRVADERSPNGALLKITRSTHLLGECGPAEGGDQCLRWQDNPREALKGHVKLVETLDGAGTYLSSNHNSYELRRLYTGLDGRRVVIALPTLVEKIVYDTANFDNVTSQRNVLGVRTVFGSNTGTDIDSVTIRAQQGTVITSSEATFDAFGNPSDGISRGCVVGCSSAEEIVTSHTDYGLVPSSTSGWLWRVTKSWTSGNFFGGGRRKELSYEYDTAGGLLVTKGVLSGTLPLVRTNPGGAVAPDPTNASGGSSAPVTITLKTETRDAYGNSLTSRVNPNRCSSIEYDATYAELPTRSTAYGGLAGTDGCGATAFVTTVTNYIRGLGLVTDVRDPRNIPSRYGFDAFGRLTSTTLGNPSSVGNLSAVPATIIEYFPPEDATTRPYSIVHTRSQDGATTEVGAYRESWSYQDGLGRVIVSLSEADRGAGDAGDYVASGFKRYDAAGEVSAGYDPWFYDAAHPEFLFVPPPGTPATTQTVDAFKRPLRSYAPDGTPVSLAVYHALTTDIYDGNDLAQSPIAPTFSTIRRDGHSRTVETIVRRKVGATVEAIATNTTYAPTGEAVRIRKSAPGQLEYHRWMKYDTLGRRVFNAEPNTSTGFTISDQTPLTSIKAWRYAYNDAGQLVGTSDARGCGVNYHYDTGARLVQEDYSPCDATQAPYSPAPEARYQYDVADPSWLSIVDPRGKTLNLNASLTHGTLVAVYDRGALTINSHDARGRVVGRAVRLARPTSAGASTAYTPRWHVQRANFDGANRLRDETTGAFLLELFGSDAESKITYAYSNRGVGIGVSGSYGALVTERRLFANGNPAQVRLGDLAQTQRHYSYDANQRPESVTTFRGQPQQWTSSGAPTQQLLLDDLDFVHDANGNVTSIKDYRTPSEWPSGHKPVDRTFEYDALDRLTRTTYSYGGGSDTWESPFSPENAGGAGPKPSPHVSFVNRTAQQTFAYSGFGNFTTTSDDAQGFYDRSLGTTSYGSQTAGPNQLRFASNRSTGSARQGDLDATYDAAGNLIDLIVRRNGPCLPAGSPCFQRFRYDWDELGQLSRARRWDLRLTPTNEQAPHGGPGSPLPTRLPEADLVFRYDASGNRILKTLTNAVSQKTHTAYVFPTLELREVTLDEANPSSDYLVPATSMNVLIADGGSRLGRVVVSGVVPLPPGVPRQQVLLCFTDHLGSPSSLIEKSTGELVEALTYQAFGATNDDYRPARWAPFREAYRFTGKEEDVELGITYFGKRYYAPQLGVWLSPDPVTIHDLGSDSNPYAYVLGRPIVAVDRRGEEPLFAAFGVAFVTGMITEYTRQVITDPNHIHLEEVLIAGMVSGMGAFTGYLVGGGVGRLVFNQTASVGWAQLATAVFGGAASGAVSGLTDAILHGNKKYDKWDGLLDAAKGSLAATVTFGATKGLGLVYNNAKPTSAPTFEATTGNHGLDGANWEVEQIQREEIAEGWGHHRYNLGFPFESRVRGELTYASAPDVPKLKASFRLDLPTAGGAVLSGLVGEGIYQASKKTLGVGVGPSQREKHPGGFRWDVPWYGPAFIGFGWPLAFSKDLRDDVFLDGSRFHGVPKRPEQEGDYGEIMQ